MQKLLIILLLILSYSCSKTPNFQQVSIETFSDQSLTFTPASQLDQLTADAINLGQVSVNKINKQRLMLKNSTLKPLAININDLVSKFEQTTRYSISKNGGKNSISCEALLKPNQSCYIDVQLNYSPTEDYTQGIEVNLLLSAPVID